MPDTLIPTLARALVYSGGLVLAAALFPTRRLIASHPPGSVRSRWYAMSALVVFFMLGYRAYAWLFRGRHSTPASLIVPLVFFLGACFVWMAAMLSLQTAMDVRRMSLLERETVTDALTGLFNRRHLQRRLGGEVARAKRYGLPLSVLMIDIDHFKEVNDRHGHQAGDQVLIGLGKVITSSLRESDVAARYGGDEFLVITPGTSLAGAASVGVASFGDGIDTVEKLVAAADANLFLAKQQGRDRVVGAAGNGLR